MAKKKKFSRAVVYNPKNEEEFLKHQQEYMRYLRQVNSSDNASVVASAAVKVRKRWVRAGIMGQNGKISKRYERVIIPND